MPSTNSVEEKQVTTAGSWKGAASEGVVVELPSGNIVRVKRTMDLLHLLKAGRIPNPLSGMVQRMVDNKEANIALEDLDPESIKQMLLLVDETVLKCVMEPVVEKEPDPEPDEDAAAYQARLRAWKPAPDNIALGWIDLEDRMFIFTFAQGFAADLASFREEQEAAMAQLRDGKAVPKPTKRTARNK